MKIGIDLDGVVIDSETTFRTYEEIFDIDTVNCFLKFFCITVILFTHRHLPLFCFYFNIFFCKCKILCLYFYSNTKAGFITNNDELLKLKKENMRLQEENEILKKAMVIFTQK